MSKETEVGDSLVCQIPLTAYTLHSFHIFPIVFSMQCRNISFATSSLSNIVINEKQKLEKAKHGRKHKIQLLIYILLLGNYICLGIFPMNPYW